MKTKVTLSVILVCSVAFYAFRFVEDIISELGMQHQYAQKIILNNLIGRQNHSEIDGGDEEEDSGGSPDLRYKELKSFMIPRAKMLTAVIEEDKVVAAKEMCQYVQNYVHSKKFLMDYEQARKSATPTTEPPAMDPAVITAMKQSIKDQEKELVKMKASKQVPADMIKKVEAAIADQKNMIASTGDPTPNKSKWQKLYPENPEIVVKARLDEYLKLAGAVDYNASVTGTGKKKTFTNPVYEKKGLKWKAVYRAGKDVNAVTTAFVKNWLQQGIKLASVESVPSDNSDTRAKVQSSEPNPATEAESQNVTPAKGFKSLKERARKILN